MSGFLGSWPAGDVLWITGGAHGHSMRASSGLELQQHLSLCVHGQVPARACSGTFRGIYGHQEETEDGASPSTSSQPPPLGVRTQARHEQDVQGNHGLLQGCHGSSQRGQGSMRPNQATQCKRDRPHNPSATLATEHPHPQSPATISR